MITVHHLNNSRSQRVLWLLEELGISYQVVHYKRGADMRAPAELRKIHPLGKSPVITDGDVVVAETGAIIEYILEVYGNGRLQAPIGTPARRAYTYWLHYAEGSAMPLLLLKLIFLRMPQNVPALLKPLVKKIAAKAQATVTDPQLSQHVHYWNDALTPTGWFAGADFSAADIMMSFPLEAAASRVGLDQQRHAAVLGFLERIHARPAYQRAIQTGGPYELMK